MNKCHPQYHNKMQNKYVSSRVDIFNKTNDITLIKVQVFYVTSTTKTGPRCTPIGLHELYLNPKPQG